MYNGGVVHRIGRGEEEHTMTDLCVLRHIHDSVDVVVVESITGNILFPVVGVVCQPPSSVCSRLCIDMGDGEFLRTLRIAQV